MQVEEYKQMEEDYEEMDSEYENDYFGFNLDEEVKKEILEDDKKREEVILKWFSTNIPTLETTMEVILLTLSEESFVAKKLVLDIFYGEIKNIQKKDIGDLFIYDIENEIREEILNIFTELLKVKRMSSSEKIRYQQNLEFQKSLERDKELNKLKSENVNPINKRKGDQLEEDIMKRVMKESEEEMKKNEKTDREKMIEARLRRFR